VTSAPVIALEEVSACYGGVPALRDVSVHVSPAETLAVLGPSGSGKSTMIRVILGLLAPERGVVRLEGEIVTSGPRIIRPPHERGLAVVFQDLALWPHLTVKGNLDFGLAANGVPRREREGRIAAMLVRVGLSALEMRYPGELSGGERQRVAIARALVLRPRAVLLDEPLSNLDLPLRQSVLELFRQLFREDGSAVVYVTHDLREAEMLADRFAVLENGAVVQVGMLEDLRLRPATPFIGSLSAL
jgi:ABC-type Fe3+/spermidine/putrescine transport system ATPase subunit